MFLHQPNVHPPAECSSTSRMCEMSHTTKPACHNLSQEASTAGQKEPKGAFRFWFDERRFKGKGKNCIVQKALFQSGGVCNGSSQCNILHILLYYDIYVFPFMTGNRPPSICYSNNNKKDLAFTLNPNPVWHPDDWNPTGAHSTRNPSPRS